MNEKIKELETELQEANESINWWTNRFKAIEKENQKLNKIIDELENYLKVGIAMNFNMNNNKFSEQTVDNYNDILNKLIELKKRGRISEYN